MLPRITTLLLVAAALLLTPFAGSAEDKDGWISLFNGKNFDGWKIGDAKQGKWKIENGNIVANGPRSHLYTIKEFKNFEFKAEVMTTPGSNSGIYFHTKYQKVGFPSAGYESQVNVSHGDPVKTGSLWGVVKLYETPAKDNKWWEQHIIVRGQNIVVKINGKTVLDYTEPKGVQGGRKISSGSFALQAHDPKSVIYYRKLRVKPLK
ncbi:MAG TPA: DUF1080 domain-containing protein [Planctomycetaceae bacterium]|nr:DUF1080 domain-containing protein [Planctomycetaceae bacterium]HCD00523.1 DUF1080 domain-containing protein [Planctomycetaceae bacterium]